MNAMFAAILTLIGIAATVWGYLASASCVGSALAIYGLAVVAFGFAAGLVAGFRVLSISIPFGFGLILGGLYLAQLSGCL